MFFGLLLIVIGVVFLLQNVGVIAEVGPVIWPIVLIVFGLSMLGKKRSCGWCRPDSWKGKKEGEDSSAS